MAAELTLALPRDPRYVVMTRKVARSMLGELGVAEDLVQEVELALTEACSNAVRHAVGSASYTVTLKADEHGCDIEVIDTGPGFTPPRHAVSGDGYGYGLFLIGTLVDQVSFDQHTEGMSVRLWKSWAETGAGDGHPVSQWARTSAS